LHTKDCGLNPFPLFMSLLLIGFGLELLDGTPPDLWPSSFLDAMPELAVFSAGCRE